MFCNSDTISRASYVQQVSNATGLQPFVRTNPILSGKKTIQVNPILLTIDASIAMPLTLGTTVEPPKFQVKHDMSLTASIELPMREEVRHVLLIER